jgi:hypothetical protein
MKSDEKKKRRDGRSPRHIRYQKRLHNICRAAGFATTLEPIYRCPVQGLCKPIPYRPDIEAKRGDRHIIIEVDGPFGHSTRQSYEADLLKIRRIRETFGKHIETYAFTFKRLARWTNKEIAEEMRL